MAADQIRDVRRFNRTVAERVGVLQDHYLDGTRPYGQARLLWEIGDGETHDVRSVRARLGLDSGYASRLLRALERDGLVDVAPHPGDRRVRTVRLTKAGWREREQLDARSDALAASLLDPLDARQRDRLLAAMAEVERLLTASVVTLDVLDPDHPDAVHCLKGFAGELGALFGFDPANSLLPDPGELRAPRGLFLVARLHGEPVGCAGLKLPAGAPAEIKRLWVSPRARGLGLARRLLSTLEERAVAHGRDLVRLDTNKALTAAIRLYRDSGYTEIPAFNDEPYAHHWFEKRLTREA
ncbi:DNA-binding MarR family transcriptional regulator [Streptomyces sp. KhCrAH-43]|uniref:bifunctional helix-turn-helix transcriptional regulator/GNAT family N-acetyltransferase n=1 Tax=unclassified Streptomyces TaxID=2593676 RepID=UPI0003761578|nr:MULTISPECIES: helix-turn-helix domain-containing GNAT family N-acetyltransferase [unclassified Streptomyces]MYS34031.1 GNAT family N-acetyltransferase [Streptomyces sp. SID4920]MYX70190.1 GNAT family N-acetyltransferase [Streptomyces sp. SID8373]RAJ60999.1 DNA-binding MarR family transcriptional regulator [Streptomyces sp. KhCrAH-43]